MPAFIYATADANSNSVQTQFIPFEMPTVQTGDLMIVAISHPLGDGVVITPPSDAWTLIHRINNVENCALAVYYKFAINEPHNLVWSTDQAFIATGVLSIYRGVDDFWVVDAEAGQATASSTTHNLPTPPNAVESPRYAIGIWSVGNPIAVSSNRVWTQPSGWHPRAQSSHTVNGDVTCLSSVFLADITSTTTPATAATINVAGLPGCTLIMYLTSSRDTLSVADVDQVMKGLYPPGADDLYDWETDAAEIHKLVLSEHEAIKDQGHDIVDVLRLETQPAHAKALLDAWEGTLGLSSPSTAIASQASTYDRSAAVVGKWREHGAVTPNAIRAAVAPLLGYADSNDLQILECSRQGLRTAHTFIGGGTVTIPGPGSVPVLFYTSPGGSSTTGTCPFWSSTAVVSAMGAQVRINITHPKTELLSFTLTSPAGTIASLPAGVLGIGDVTAMDFYLYFPSMAGELIQTTIGGTTQWKLTITSTHTVSGTLFLSSSLFIESAGHDDSGADAMGGEIFTYAVMADDTLVGANPDYEGAMRAIRRITPAYAVGYLCLIVDPAHPSPYPNDDRAIPGGRADRVLTELLIGSRGMIPYE